MSTFNWSDEYAVGNIVIDEQNKQFLKLIEDLTVSNREALITILDELMVYAETHFDDEEDILESLEFNELVSHREMHKEFITHVGKMVGKLYSNTITAEKIQEELIEWFIKHISIEDARYKNLMKDSNDSDVLLPTFSWKEKYAIGNDNIDKQHKQLFKLIQKIPLSASNLETVLENLVHYLSYHFASEEAFMEENHDPNREEHTMEHRAFTEELLELQHKNSAHTLNRETLFQILQEWLQHHILTVDIKLKNYTR